MLAATSLALALCMLVVMLFMRFTVTRPPAVLVFMGPASLFCDVSVLMRMRPATFRSLSFTLERIGRNCHVLVVLFNEKKKKSSSI